MHGAAMLLGTAKILEQKGAPKYAQLFQDAAHAIYDITDELQKQVADFGPQSYATEHKVLPGSPERDDVFASEYRSALESLLDAKA